MCLMNCFVRLTISHGKSMLLPLYYLLYSLGIGYDRVKGARFENLDKLLSVIKGA